MPTDGVEWRNVLINRKKVQRKIKSFVETHWPEQDFVGRLPGYRYCYSMKDGQHTEYTLRYLLWLKSNKENWKQYARRLRFHSRLGGTVTLEEVLAQTRSSGKPMEELWEGSKRLLKTLMVPMSDFLLIQQLSE